MRAIVLPCKAAAPVKTPISVQRCARLGHVVAGVDSTMTDCSIQEVCPSSGDVLYHSQHGLLGCTGVYCTIFLYSALLPQRIWCCATQIEDRFFSAPARASQNVGYKPPGSHFAQGSDHSEGSTVLRCGGGSNDHEEITASQAVRHMSSAEGVVPVARLSPPPPPKSGGRGPSRAGPAPLAGPPSSFMKRVGEPSPPRGTHHHHNVPRATCHLPRSLSRPWRRADGWRVARQHRRVAADRSQRTGPDPAGHLSQPQLADFGNNRWRDPLPLHRQLLLSSSPCPSPIALPPPLPSRCPPPRHHSLPLPPRLPPASSSCVPLSVLARRCPRSSPSLPSRLLPASSSCAPPSCLARRCPRWSTPPPPRCHRRLLARTGLPQQALSPAGPASPTHSPATPSRGAEGEGIKGPAGPLPAPPFPCGHPR